jgi:hypothetical protein
MGMDRSRSFDRKLEDVITARLRGGQSPEALLEDLQARLGDAEADAILSRAEARLRPAAPSNLAVRILTGLAYVWTVMLMFQNFAILITAVELVEEGDAGSIAIGQPLIGLALLKVGLLCAGIALYKRRRSLLTTGLYALMVLYAFPLGVFIDPLISGYPTPDQAAAPMKLSALLSYLSVVLIGLAWWLGREASPRPAETSVFG